MARSLWRLTFSSSVVAAGQPAAGVDQQEGAALPLGLDLLAVAGDAGLLLDDGLAAADDAVQQRRLADVGAADDGDDGQVIGASVSARPARGAARRASAVGGDDLDRAGQVVGGGAVEEAALDRHTSGSR